MIMIILRNIYKNSENFECKPVTLQIILGIPNVILRKVYKILKTVKVKMRNFYTNLTVLYVI